jgi:hypothetical protein
MTADEAARELLALTGYEVTFPVKQAGVLGALLSALFEASEFEVERKGAEVTIRKRRFRIEIEVEVPHEH